MHAKQLVSLNETANPQSEDCPLHLTKIKLMTTSPLNNDVLLGYNTNGADNHPLRLFSPPYSLPHTNQRSMPPNIPPKLEFLTCTLFDSTSFLESMAT